MLPRFVSHRGSRRATRGRQAAALETSEGMTMSAVKCGLTAVLMAGGLFAGGASARAQDYIPYPYAVPVAVAAPPVVVMPTPVVAPTVVYSTPVYTTP